MSATGSLLNTKALPMKRYAATTEIWADADSSLTVPRAEFKTFLQRLFNACRSRFSLGD